MNLIEALECAEYVVLKHSLELLRVISVELDTGDVFLRDDDGDEYTYNCLGEGAKTFEDATIYRLEEMEWENT